MSSHDSRHGITRREALKIGGSAAAAVLAAPFLDLRRFRVFPWADQEYSERAIDLVERSLVIDMLAPLTINSEVQDRWGRDGSGITEADLAEFRESGIDVFHAAFGIGGRDASEAHRNAMTYVAALNGLIANRADAFARVDSVEDFERARGPETTGVLIGIQNAAHFREPDDVDAFHALGQRVSQLTYNSRNRIGNGSTERVDGGISDFGVAIIERMNRVGMAVDVSHCGDQTTLQAFEISGKPVLITHSNCRALVPGHPRCKTDEAIRAMAASGGVMGITGVRNFVKADEPTTLEDMLDHFDHVRDLVGVEHLGVGSDVDLHGYDDLPEEQYKRLKESYKGSYAFRDKIDIEAVAHPKRMYDLTEGLIGRGYTDPQIEGILGGNFARVLGEIWDVPPVEEDEEEDGTEEAGS